MPHSPEPRRPIVLLDSDGPLSCFVDAYLRVIAKITGSNPTIDDVDRWDIHECAFFKRLEAARLAGGDESDLRKCVDKKVSKRGFCTEMDVHPEAKQSVEQLIAVADVYVVTSPWHSCLTWACERTSWLHNTFGIRASNVLHVSAKHLIRGDVFVDDRASHVEAWAEAWPKGKAFLFDMHHNRAEPSDRRAAWPEIVAYVLALAAKSQPGLAPKRHARIPTTTVT